MLFGIPVTTNAPIVPKLETKEQMKAYVEKRALEEGINPSVPIAVIECESHWDSDAVGDHGHSHGLVQIYNSYHPEITMNEANDPRFAIDYLLSNLKDGRGHLWSCYRKLNGASRS